MITGRVAVVLGDVLGETQQWTLINIVTRWLSA